MSDTTYHIKIKKEYVSAILEDLKQVEAIEIVEDIPEWQQREALKRLAAMKLNPSNILTEEVFFKSLCNQ
jgi:Mg/Co/Ni transporter MgtE